MYLRIILPVMLFAAVTAVGEPVSIRTLKYRTTLRTVSVAEKAEVISNPLHYPQFKFLIPDGTYVEKEDIITEFDVEPVVNELKNLKRERETIEAELARDLADLDSGNLSLRDDLAALNDKIAVLEARIARYEALPDPDEVEIAGGRHGVAQLELDAARKDVERARDRFERGMISRAELDNYEFSYREKEALMAHAKADLDYMSLPASSLTMRKMELEMTNLVMKVEKLRHEIEEKVRIAEIQQKGSATRRDRIDARIEEQEEFLKNARVLASIDGYVMHLRAFRNRILNSGDKMWKGFNYLRMPDRETLVFKGVLLESERKFFKVGDSAGISVVAEPGEALNGRVTFISTLAHDMSEKEEQDFGESRESGIMVYDITITPDTRPEWLLLGMHATCELSASEPLIRPSVPAMFVTRQNDKNYLSFDGKPEEVTGDVVDGYFVLDDLTFADRDVSLFSQFKANEQEDGDSAESNDLIVSGELEPSDTMDVRVKNIYRWQKVSWLIDEDTYVKQGEVVARLDPKETDDEIRKRQSSLTDAESARETAAEQAKLQASEGEFQLAYEKNLLAIAEMDLELTRNGLDLLAANDVRLTMVQAELNLEQIDKKLNRTAEKKITALSPLELAKMRRDRERAAMALEAAQIRLTMLEEGSDALALKEAELAYLEQSLKVKTIAKEVETENFRMDQRLREAEKREARAQRWLEQSAEWKENLTVCAPRDGIVRYTKIWNSGVLSKATAGSMVGDRFVIMSIADVSKMHVRLEIPEKYFTWVHKGMRVDVEIASITDALLEGVVSEIEFLFESRQKKDTQMGLYSGHEPLGETIFYVHVQIPEQKGIKLKPGAIANVRFSFDQFADKQVAGNED